MIRGIRSALRTAPLWALVLVPGAAAAQEDAQIAGTVSLATDYVFRGITQTEERPQLQGELGWAHESGVYTGVWSTNTHVGGEGNSLEFDPYIGYAGTLDQYDIAYDVGYWHYFYPGSESDLDFGELYAIPSYSTGPWGASLELWYALDYFGNDFFDDTPAFAYAGEVTRELGRVTLSGRLGQQTFDGPGDLPDQDYVYYDLGVSGDWRGLTLEASWHDTDGVREELAAPDAVDGRFVVGISHDF